MRSRRHLDDGLLAALVRLRDQVGGALEGDHPGLVHRVEDDLQQTSLAELSVVPGMSKPA